MEFLEAKGIVLDADYTSRNSGASGAIRISLKTGEGVLSFLDTNFIPYFYLLPGNTSINKADVKAASIANPDGSFIEAVKIEEVEMELLGKKHKLFKIFLTNPKDVPRFSSTLQQFGTCYENDIPFWKRYLIDKNLSPIQLTIVKYHLEGQELLIDEIHSEDRESDVKLECLSFDIETYNPLGVPRENKDPVIMISYTCKGESAVLTSKQIDRKFVKNLGNEKALIQEFISTIKRLNPDIIAGYNSSNFDIPYLMKRAKALGIKFDICRYEGEEPRLEHHGLISAVKIPGRINLDVYNVARFVATVGASEKVIKVNSFKLYEVYHAISGKDKNMVEKTAIWKLWDDNGKDTEELADYSLSDALSLHELYEFFIPIELEVSKVSRMTLGEASISTTSQMVEFMLMHNAVLRNQVIPNRPSEYEITERLSRPYEGAYVMTPDAGIYEKIMVYDFRGLYPSIIIAHNIDPSSVCSENCEDCYDAPEGTKFRKQPMGIIPVLLKMLIEERSAVKKLFKKEPDNKALAARSTALKIIANSFYGYLGYARSRWYSRECAAEVTAYGRLYIHKTIDQAAEAGFRSLYTDTDSVFLLMGNRTKDDAEQFLKKFNASLPSSMELEYEDFYTRAVFVGKRGGSGTTGAKKKYAMLSESGRVKIKGFELVRRDWAKIARDTQLAVLEAILKEGSKDKAVAIVKNTVARLQSGNVPIKELAIHTQLRKGLKNYDVKSPELNAAKKAVEQGVKTKADVEGAAIGYVITKHGNTISEKAEIEETAKDYDPDYYIDHQILPATLKILKELGYSADELKTRGSQKKL